MTRNITRAFALALAFMLVAATPHSRPRLTANLPRTPLHTEFNVEVNAKGQVVLVKSGKSCKDLNFNAKTYGNVLQMWIRHPDGSATVGMYRVTYDYNPRTKRVDRGIRLLYAGGRWGSQVGAAQEMLNADNARAAKANKPLPSLDTIVRPTSKPTHKPQ
ncbi:MAG: hypothetical protein M3Y21_05230 [Candidatus Eremiobacteraeota bacterium]|nr:hypothetical protein [Candidatus Eremiobacteraeota bacterium]